MDSVKRGLGQGRLGLKMTIFLKRDHSDVVDVSFVRKLAMNWRMDMVKNVFFEASETGTK